MKKTLVFLFFLITLSNVKANNIVIEVAVSYDLNYSNNVNNPEYRIEQIINRVTEIYEDFNINFVIVQTEYFGDVDLSTDATVRLTKEWVKPYHCYKRDLVVHFTGDLDGIVGEASANPPKLCASNNIDFWTPNGSVNNFVAITSFQSNMFREAETTAHEIGHLLGLSHEDSDFCSNLNNDEIGLMCVVRNGSFNENGDEFYKFSSSFTSKINQALNRSCVDRQDFETDYICEEVQAGWISDTEIDRTCEGEGFKDISLVIINDETQREYRSTNLCMDWYGEVELQGQILNYTPNVDSDHSSNEFCYSLPTFTLQPFEEYVFEFKINYDNIVSNYPNTNNLIQSIKWVSYVDPPFDGGSTSSGALSRNIGIYDNSIQLNGSTTVQDLLVAIQQKEDPIYDYQKLIIHVDGVLSIDEDIFLDSKYHFVLTENSRIEVIEGSTFTLVESSITPCNNDRWDKVYVESGSHIDFQKVFIEHAKYGIRSEESSNINDPQSNVSIQSCEIEDILYKAIDIRCPSKSVVSKNVIKGCGYGIRIKGDFDIEKLESNMIENAFCGIYLEGQSQFLEVKENVLKHCNIGLWMNNSSGTIVGNTTSNNVFSFNLQNQYRSKILNNTIGGTSRGLNISNSTSILVEGNTIGLDQDSPDIGINLFNVLSSRVIDNPEIYAKKIAINATNCNLTIKDNPYIDVDGLNDTNSGGILLTGCTNTQVISNSIYATLVVFGIESNNSSGSIVKNNFITMSPSFVQPNSAAVRLMGSVDEEFEENILFAFNQADGVLVQNSSSITLKCNAIDYTLIGLNINGNSAAQHIESNLIEGSLNYDLSISSEIGIQYHLGNDFIGGSVIASLSDEEIANSIFHVNDTYANHFPTDPSPDENWFIANSDELDKECDLNNIGPGFTFYHNENALCAYYEHLKTLNDFNRNKYLINLGHILKFTESTSGILPDCIKLDSTFNAVCGLEEIIEIIFELENTNIDDNDDSEFNNNEGDDEHGNTESHNENNNTSIGSDSLLLDSLRNELTLIHCPDSLIQIMKDVWIAYIDLLEDSENLEREANLTNIRTIAQLCSTEYGEAIHLARSILLNYGDYRYYDVYDSCSIPIEQRKNKPAITSFDMSVHPNPSTGEVNISWNQEISGTLRIFNTAGMEVLNQSIANGSSYQSFLSLPGVYIASFVNSKGEFINNKFVIVK